MDFVRRIAAAVCIGASVRGEPALKASAAHQGHLLELQAVDTRLDQLAHRRSRLPEIAELAAAERRLATVRDLLIAAETERSDVDRQRVKADTDVEQVRARAARDQQRLDSGAVSSPKELENLQSEIVSLGRRQSELEDVELEILQRLEDIDARIAELRTESDQLSAQAAAVTSRRDEALGAIASEEGEVRQRREVLAAAIEEPLLRLYERVRDQQGGIAASELRQKRCGGCRMELNSAELAEVRAAPADEVVHHEECGRILIRTAESGL